MNDERADERDDVPALHVHGLSKSYDDVHALRHIELEIADGELAALVGHNGAGKSTLLGVISGLVEPTTGEVLVAGYEAGSLEARAALSYAPDNPILYDDLSVWEHLEYIGGLHGATNWRARGEDLIERFDLTDRADDLPSRFSRGMRQKTALIVALVRPFDLLLVDEPFVGLDVKAQAALVEILLEQARDGAAVFVATHQPALLEHVGRCVMLDDGHITHNGPPDDGLLAALARGSG
jgi:ABC-type multidrug transport system ATPase subunit